MLKKKQIGMTKLWVAILAGVCVLECNAECLKAEGDAVNTCSCSNDVKEYREEEKATKSVMQDKMQQIGETKNPALDYLYGMIPHHEAAIAMAKSLLKYGGDNMMMINLAKNIVDDQQKEIRTMESMIKARMKSKKEYVNEESAYLARYYEILEEGKQDAWNEVPFVVDEAFAKGMIPQHQMAVDMSEAILECTDDQEVIDLANQVIKTKTEEMELFQDFLDLGEEAE